VNRAITSDVETDRNMLQRPSRRAFLTIPPALAGAAMALPRIACAEPRVGAPFPAFSGRALDDRVHTNRDFMGRRVFVVAMTGIDAQTQVGHWLNNAEARLGRGHNNIFSLVALHLGFYAIESIVRSEARRGTPQHRWSYVYLDRDGVMQRSLGLPNDNRVPWAYVIEPNGTVSVAGHGIASDPFAQQIWARMTAP
jgi:hypothetical protein